MPNRLSRPALALSAAAVTALMLTACGSNDGPSVSDPTGSTPSAAATPEASTPAPEPTSEAPETTTSAPETSTTAPSTPSEKPSETSKKTDKKPATGKNVIVAKKKKFQVTMPKGWQDIQKKTGNMKIIEVFIGDHGLSNGKLTNINVASVKAPITDTKALADQSAKQWKDKKEIVKDLPERKIAGEDANGYVKHDKKNTQSQTQWFVAHGGTVYIVTLTNAPKSQSTADKALDQVLGSWTWR